MQSRKSDSTKHPGVRLNPHGQILMLKVGMAATTTAEVGHQDHQGLGMMGLCGGCVLFDGEHLEKR